MWDDYNIELEAVNRIKGYFDVNPMIRSLSARQRHTLKFRLKEQLQRVRRDRDATPHDVPDDRIHLGEMVEYCRTHPVLA
jgi:hypothetical protein